MESALCIICKGFKRRSRQSLDLQLDNLKLSIKFLAQIFRGVIWVKLVDRLLQGTEQKGYKAKGYRIA